MSEHNDVGVIGLGVMGRSLARNFASRGLRVAGYDRDLSGARAFAAAHPEARHLERPTSFDGAPAPYHPGALAYFKSVQK